MSLGDENRKLPPLSEDPEFLRIAGEIGAIMSESVAEQKRQALAELEGAFRGLSEVSAGPAKMFATAILEMLREVSTWAEDPVGIVYGEKVVDVLTRTITP